jgi:23S rRNA (cytosine1962-C5)-methyltransferase
LSGRGRKRCLGGHPWIYADDVAEGEGRPGELLPVFEPGGAPLGWGLFSASSRIAVRLVTRERRQPDRAFWLERVRNAIALRDELGLLDEEGACRLIAGDAEGLPGLNVDRYSDVLVLQSGCPGSDAMRDFLLELIEECMPFELRAVLDRSDASVRRLEELEARVEWKRGGPLESVEVVEREQDGLGRLIYEVSLTAGHKTGHYLDQCANRRRAARFAQGRDVLDVFSYDGLFGIRAALAGASSVLCLDQSSEAGERCLRNAERNGVADRLRFERVNAMRDLRRRVAEEQRYGLVVVDPPAFARNKRQVDGAARGYRELNGRALSLLQPGGVLVSASCSYNVHRRAFLEHIAAAALQSGRDVRLFDYAGASPDHPVDPTLPESEYLKCAFLRVGA